MDVIKYAEHIFKLYVINQPNQINTKKNLKTKMILELCQHFGDVATKLLPPQHEISINEPLLEEDHRLWLLLCVADSYLTLRSFTYWKHYGETVIHFGKPSQRHHLKKLIFNNQKGVIVHIQVVMQSIKLTLGWLGGSKLLITEVFRNFIVAKWIFVKKSCHKQNYAILDRPSQGVSGILVFRPFYFGVQYTFYC